MLTENSITNSFAIPLKRIYYRQYTALLDATHDSLQRTRFLYDALSFSLDNSVPSVISTASRTDLDPSRSNSNPISSSANPSPQLSLFLFNIDSPPPIEVTRISNLLIESDAGDFSNGDIYSTEDVNHLQRLQSLFLQATNILLHRSLHRQGWIRLGKEFICASNELSGAIPLPVTLKLNMYLSAFTLVVQPMFSNHQYLPLSFDILEQCDSSLANLFDRCRSKSDDELKSLDALFPRMFLAPLGLEGYLLPQHAFKYYPSPIEKQLNHYVSCLLPPGIDSMDADELEDYLKVSFCDTVKVLLPPSSFDTANKSHFDFHSHVQAATIVNYPRSLVFRNAKSPFPIASCHSANDHKFGITQLPASTVESLARHVINSLYNPIPSSLLKLPQLSNNENTEKALPSVETSTATLSSSQQLSSSSALPSTLTPSSRQPRKRVPSTLSTSTLPDKVTYPPDSALNKEVQKQTSGVASGSPIGDIASPITSPKTTQEQPVPPQDPVVSSSGQGMEGGGEQVSVLSFGDQANVGLFDTDSNMIGGTSFQDLDMNLDIEMQFDLDLRVTDDDWNFFDDKKKMDYDFESVVVRLCSDFRFNRARFNPPT